MPGVKRKVGLDVDRLGTWYTPGRSAKRNAIDQVTKIMAPRSGVTGSEARDILMAKTLGKGAPKVGNRLFTTKRPYKPRRKRGGLVIQNKGLNGMQAGTSKSLAPKIDQDVQNMLKEGKIHWQGEWYEPPPPPPPPKKTGFWDDFWGGFKKGFNGVVGIGKTLHLPGSEYIPTIGDDNPSEGDGIHKVLRKLPMESKVTNVRGTGVHHSVPDIKLDPELSKAVNMMKNTPLDKDAKNSLSNLPQAQHQHINNLKHRRLLPGLRPRRKITKGGRTFVTFRNLLVSRDAAQ